MDRGVYAELEVTGESVCRVADASEDTKVRTVSRSTFAEHLSAAQSKLLDVILEY